MFMFIGQVWVLLHFGQYESGHGCQCACMHICEFAMWQEEGSGFGLSSFGSGHCDTAICVCEAECDIMNHLGEDVRQHACMVIRSGRHQRLRSDLCQTFSSIDGGLGYV